MPDQRARGALGRLRHGFGVDAYDVLTRPAKGAEFAPPDGYEFRFATALDLAACDPYHTELDQHERARGADRLAAGHRLVVGLQNDLVVFTMWVNPRYLNVPGIVKRCLRHDQWFVYKAFTSPDHRKRELYQAGLRFVLAEMAKQELKELVGYAHTKKTASRSGLDQLGFGVAGRMFHVRLPGSEHTHLSPALARAFEAATTSSRCTGEGTRRAA